MKKIFSLIAIAAVALTMFTSCSSKDEPPTPTPTPGKAKLTLSGDKLTVAVAATGKFTITSDIAAPEAIVIEVKSSDATKLTVDPASVTIAKDKKTIEGTYTGVADGKAKITITTTSTVASVEKSEIEVTVGDAPVGGAKIAQMTIEETSWGGIVVSYENDPDVALFNFWKIEYPPYSAADPALAMDFGLLTAGGAMAMGTVVNDILNISAQAKDSDITLGNMTESTNYPILWSSQYTTLATGEDIYLVVACGDFDTSFKDYRAWVKVNLGTAGGIDNLKVLEAYICLDDGAFKVGQTK